MFHIYHREELTEKYNAKLSSEMNGPIHEVMSRLIKAVTKSKITIPGSFKRYVSVAQDAVFFNPLLKLYVVLYR